MLVNFLTAYIFKPIAQKQFTIDYTTEIDRYVTSKNPKTVADVEHWEKQYSHKQLKGWAL